MRALRLQNVVAEELSLPSIRKTGCLALGVIAGSGGLDSWLEYQPNAASATSGDIATGPPGSASRAALDPYERVTPARMSQKNVAIRRRERGRVCRKMKLLNVCRKDPAHAAAVDCENSQHEWTSLRDTDSPSSNRRRD